MGWAYAPQATEFYHTHWVEIIDIIVFKMRDAGNIKITDD